MGIVSATLDTPRVRRGTLGAIEGALALGIIGGLAGAAAGSFAPRGLVIGVGIGTWLGAIAGCYRSVRRAAPHDAAALACANAVILGAVVGAIFWLHASHRIDVGSGLPYDSGPTSDDIALGLGVLLGSLIVVGASTVVARWFVRAIPDRMSGASTRAKVLVPVTLVAAILPMATFFQTLEQAGPGGMTRLDHEQWTVSTQSRELIMDRTEDLARYTMTSVKSAGLEQALKARDTGGAGRILRSLVPDDGSPDGSNLFFEVDLLAIVDANGAGVAELGTRTLGSETNVAAGRASEIDRGTTWSFPELDVVLSGKTDLTVVGVTQLPQHALVSVTPVADGALVAAIRLERLAEWISFRTMASVAFYDAGRNLMTAKNDARFPQRMAANTDSMMSTVVRNVEGVRVATAAFPLMMYTADVPAGAMGQEAAKHANARGWGSMVESRARQPLVATAFDAGPWVVSPRSWAITMGLALAVALVAVGVGLLMTRRPRSVSPEV